MAAISAATVAKIATAVLSNDKARNALLWIIVAILSPFILIIIAVAVIFSGGSSNNQSVVDLCFSNASLSEVVEEYKPGIENMREAFSNLDAEMGKVELEEGSFDDYKVKSIFYTLFYSEEKCQDISAKDFVSCFYYEDERSRLVPIEDIDGMVSYEIEYYTVNVLHSDMLVVYEKISSKFGVLYDEDIMMNSNTIYYTQKYGSVDELPSDVPFVSIDGFVEPVANWKVSVSSEYGNRIHPINFTSHLHGGIDLAKPAGTQIFSVLDGVVTSAIYSDSGYGYHIIIDHGDGFTTLYAHCSSLLVTVGQEVKAGEKIALVGTTGSSTGNHLHFETMVNGEKVNPRTYLP